MEHIGCQEYRETDRGNTSEVKNGTHGLRCATVHCVVHGSCMIHHVVKDNPTLYNWITRQHQLHKKQMGFSKICVEKLKELSFPWKQPNKK